MIVKIATTEEIIQLNSQAKKRRYTRVIPEEVIHRLEPGAIHVTTSHSRGQEYFIRVLWMLKMPDRNDPYEQYLDMGYRDYNLLKRWDGESKLNPLEERT